MKRLLAALSVVLLSLGAVACEAPGAPEGPAGGNTGLEQDEEAQTQLGPGGEGTGEDAGDGDAEGAEDGEG